MSESVLIGEEPIRQDDKLIQKALSELSPAILKLSKAARAHHAPSQTRAPSMITGSSFALLLLLVITTARLWVRGHRPRAFGADDYAIIPGALGCVVYLSLLIAQESAGCLGKNIYHCTYQEFRWFYELAHYCFPLFYFTVFCVKISITLANRRITGMTSKNWQIAHWVYLALLGCLMPICVLLNIFPCSPIPTYFTLQSIAREPDPKTIRCLNQDAISLATRYSHIVTDWLLLPVPLIIIYRLQMPVGRKIRLMLVFCLGFISSAASIVRNVLVTRQTNQFDVTYDYYTQYAWNVVDIFFATVVASLPPLNGLAEKGIDKMWSSRLFSGDSLMSKVRLRVSGERSSQPGHGYSRRLPDDSGSHELTGYRKGDDESLSVQLDADHKVRQPADVVDETSERRW